MIVDGKERKSKGGKSETKRAMNRDPEKASVQQDGWRRWVRMTQAHPDTGNSVAVENDDGKYMLD
jgi:hypothetical protein